ncbi:MAG: hypothetical protein ABW136_03260 [Steroidobacteraceae bacterium]
MPLAAAILAAALPATCLPSEGIDAICGPVASEDLARVPRTPWLIASGLNVGAPANLYAIDTGGNTSQPMSIALPPPEAAWRDGCSAPPKRDGWSIDGINLRVGADGLTLFAANHGDRHAIELFRITASTSLSATWIGCVPMPEGTLANAVVPLKDGGLIATSFYDPRDSRAWTRMAGGENTGSVWEWQRKSGWRKLPIAVSGANGLELSTDERTLYVSAWSGRRLVLFDRRSGAASELPLDFLPDNIKRQDDGTLLVAGQRARVEDIAACQGPACPQPWVIARVDPRSRSVTSLLARNGSDVIGYACAALLVGDTLYFTARGDARISRARLQ